VVIKTSVDATKKYGTSASASRLITGNNILYSKLERSVAKLHNTESATIFSSGYAANLGVIKALMGQGDLIVLDKLAHSCMIEGALASRAEVKRFLHNNYDDLEKILSANHKKYNNILICTESVFSMDGDRADLKTIRKTAKKYGAWLLVDYAHDIEIFIKKPVKPYKNEIKMGTFSKALGSLGGYISGSKKLIEYINSKAATLIYSTALPPAVLGASLKALEIAVKNKELAKKALENARYFLSVIASESEAIHRKIILARKDELPRRSAPLNDDTSQIVPIIIGDTQKTIKISEVLEKEGFLVHPIKPPTVPQNTSRLRVSFSASHTKKQIDELAKAIIEITANN
ncbi:MAG TPA: 8-amino-7-oxononanoate synthase, partial [Alphaproteobacteria bacterium]|nr:8-amino-7-oxononanoate synthase [Alphaproteobacteria bacterium]